MRKGLWKAQDEDITKGTYTLLYRGLLPMTHPTGDSRGGLELYLVFLLRGSSPLCEGWNLGLYEIPNLAKQKSNET